MRNATKNSRMSCDVAVSLARWRFELGELLKSVCDCDESLPTIVDACDVRRDNMVGLQGWKAEERKNGKVQYKNRESESPHLATLSRSNHSG